MKRISLKYGWMILLVWILIGCQSDSPQQSNKPLKFQSLTTDQQRMTQEVSNEVKDYISRHDHIRSVYAVNTFDALVIAFEVNHFDRFQLQTYKDQLDTQMKRKYPEYESIVSTDQKVILELQRIEQAINNQTMSINDIQREIRRLIKLTEDNA